jgi:hypothetical protein
MSLEVNYKTLDNRMSAKFSGSDVQDVFEQIAKFSEIFETSTICGNCDSDEVRPSVRVSGKYKYYEKKCCKCGYSFSYGQKEGHELFPKWKNKWTKYQAPAEDVEVDDVFDEKKVPAKKATK